MWQGDHDEFEGTGEKLGKKSKNFFPFPILYYHKIRNFSRIPFFHDPQYNGATSMEEGVIMEEKDWIKLFSAQNQIQKVMEMNRQTERFGLALTQEEAKLLVENRNLVLKEQQRVEVGEGILPQLIFAFCDSAYIDQ